MQTKNLELQVFLKTRSRSLSHSLLYPDSRPDGRVKQLAQQLYALHPCVEIIARGIVRCALSPSFPVTFILAMVRSLEPPPASIPGYSCVFSEFRNTATQQNDRLGICTASQRSLENQGWNDRLLESHL